MKKRLAKFFKLAVKLTLLTALGVGGWYGYRLYVPEEEDEGLGELPTAAAGIRDITVSVQATGVLQPIRVVEIKSKGSGEILVMAVEMGDYVEAGDLIAQIDTAILDQELKQTQADYESAKIRLQIADNQYKRAQSLFEQDLISENDLETSQQSFSNAEAQLLRNEASLDLGRERLADATVRAPSAGTIINKTVEEGQIIASSTNNVSGGTTLVQMADLSELEIRTLVDEIDIGQIRAGLPVESKVEAFSDEAFSGAVIKIEPQAVVQQSVTTFPVLSRIDNANGKLLPGMNADVAIIIHRKPNVLAIPNEAVRTPADAREVAMMLGVGASGEDAAGGARGTASFGAAPSEGRGGGSANARGGAGRSSGGGGRRGESADGGGTGVGGRGGSGGRNGDGGGGRAGFDAATRARFESASPDERARLIAAMRGEDESRDMDPFGIEGRREEGVVFVFDARGQLATKDVVVGLRDWEYTEVLSGLSDAEVVLVLPSTSLLRSQDRLRSWARGRAGGIPGMGGGPPGGMGRGRGPGF